MKERSNLDDLKRQRDTALARGVGSGAWIDCARSLFDVFPAIYDMAKAMNEEMATLRMDLNLAKVGEFAGQSGQAHLCALLDEYHDLIVEILDAEKPQPETAPWSIKAWELVSMVNRHEVPL